MSGFEPRASEVGSDPSTNWATTTAQQKAILPSPHFWSNLSKFFVSSCFIIKRRRRRPDGTWENWEKTISNVKRNNFFAAKERKR